VVRGVPRVSSAIFHHVVTSRLVTRGIFFLTLLELQPDDGGDG
jgi:hypothetical protein